MARRNEAWFEYRGVKSTDFGIQIMDRNTVSMPAMRGGALTAAGRSGDIWIADGAHEAFDIKRRIRVPLSKYDGMAAWLSRPGWLRFSFMPGHAYDARINESGRSGGKPMEFAQVTSDADPLMEGTLVFSCQPFRYQYPAAEDISITASGTTVTNPGTAFSEPRVVIQGSGAFSVTIGTGAEASTVFFQNVDGGGIIVDTMLGDAMTFDGTQLANEKIGASELFTIQPGNNVVTWENGGDAEDGTALSGSVQSVTITPRWRSL